jgi:hypothetical protein
VSTACLVSSYRCECILDGLVTVANVLEFARCLALVLDTDGAALLRRMRGHFRKEILELFYYDENSLIVVNLASGLASYQPFSAIGIISSYSYVTSHRALRRT